MANDMHLANQIKSPVIAAVYSTYFDPRDLRLMSGFLEWLLKNRLVEWTPRAVEFFDSERVEALFKKYLI